MKLHIVLHEPEIPQNTGNIARTCAAAGGELHLIEPLGFSIDEKAVRRAGLDYWDSVHVRTYPSLDSFLADFLKSNTISSLFPATTKAPQTYCAMEYPEETWLLFGKESKGLPEEFLERNRERCIRVPMLEDRRSLNLSNAVAIISYEVLRQHGFPAMKTTGSPESFSWTE